MRFQIVLVSLFFPFECPLFVSILCILGFICKFRIVLMRLNTCLHLILFFLLFSIKDCLSFMFFVFKINEVVCCSKNGKKKKKIE